MDARAWLNAYADELGVAAPSEEEIDRLLALAGVAAHSSERIAAPIACWLAARAGTDPDQALALAKRIGGEDG
ncbi:MAG TPA: DUF6457 domain-containing protein [Solirubrobacteraceae bacterium]|nr:DUF6457 domain-containing protein [Solirubrobacteraceae bacterium]